MRTRILFVDDEPNVLSALRRMFHDMRSEWEMDFASCSGTTGRWSMPCDSSQRCVPLLPKWCRSSSTGTRRSASGETNK